MTTSGVVWPSDADKKYENKLVFGANALSARLQDEVEV